ncbi:DUF1592 domain-containing protein [Rhodopirellula sallentina]|uniref:Membrane or secreted protein containing DUF1592 n=1 Tax=Rhodopirellula sallentina SM41 TaxID=1263870 RepID=M5U462_9BACT|nr:DUF1592 domain-containing protein [Rhodopirellula sallentina]EMI56237.1 membrane or secreted protein containing DUF1592 [Rhodopirellula sallentina SM41]
MKRPVICAALLASLLASAFAVTSAATAENTRSFEQVVLPFIQEHCLDCHDASTQQGDFRLDTLPTVFNSAHIAERWDEVIGRINAGEMPPPNNDQPTAEEIETVAEWISGKIKEGEHARMARRASVAFYRLSREEYANTIEDLLGVHYDAAAPGRMNADPQWKGFERIGSELSLSPSHVEKYLAASRSILDTAYPASVPQSQTWTKDALDIDWPNRGKRDVLQEQGILDDVRTLIWPGHRLSYVEPAHQNYSMPPGIYRAKLTISGLPSKEGRAPHVTIYSPQLDRIIFEHDVIAPENAPAVFEFMTYLEGKVSMKINNEVPGPSNSGIAGRPTGQRVFTTFDNPLSRSPWQRKMTDEEGNALYPVLIFDSIQWEGPIVEAESMAKRKRFAPPAQPTLASVRDLVRRFARAAWRRPPTKQEVDRYLYLIGTELKKGASTQEACKLGMLGILASQNFYYLREGDAGQNRAVINDWELASRLSYFLWSSAPDETLFKAAEDGTLHQPATLKTQLARMFADPKIARFEESFPKQWLQLQKVGMFPPDQKLYPDYDPWLEKSMVLETTSFFAEVFKNNLPITEFLDSDWTMLNPRLAAHYGLPIPASTGFHRVSLPPDSHRGGLLTQASILSMTSDGTRHRPVHRGIWVSDVILGKTPSPPPANIDAIEPNPVDEPRATIRMKLAAHTIHAQCAACHRKIDPLGFAFDNYDAVGRWRTEEFVQHGIGENPPVDASGELPDGRPFQGPEDFKALMLDDAQPFANAFVEKLATYALRRPMTIDDRDAITAIARRSEPGGYQLQDIIRHFVESDLFLKR